MHEVPADDARPAPSRGVAPAAAPLARPVSGPGDTRSAGHEGFVIPESDAAAGGEPAADGTGGGQVLAALREEIAAIGAGLARISASPLWQLPQAELWVAAHEIETCLRSGLGAQIRVAAEIDRRGAYDTSVARSAAHALAQALRITVGDAKGRIDAARAALPREMLTGHAIQPVLPELLPVVDSGNLSAEHAKVIAGCIAQIPAAVDETTRKLCHDLIIREAANRDPANLRTVAEKIRLICDPDGKLSDTDPVDRAELHLGQRRSDGLAPIRGLLDELTMERLKVAVENLAAPAPIDQATPDPRPAPVRRAQALSEVLRRYLARGTKGPLNGGQRPQVGITIRATDLAALRDAHGAERTSGAACPPCSATSTNSDTGAHLSWSEIGGPIAGSNTGGPGHGLPTVSRRHDGGAGATGSRFRGDAGGRMNGDTGVRTRGATPPLTIGSVGVFDFGSPVSLATARQLACDGDLIPVLLDARGAILDQGRAVRLFTRAQRRALTVRDKGCAFPTCDMPAPWCEAHHIQFWSNGGPTDLANGVLLCGRHHTVIHQGSWHIEPASNPRERPPFIPPSHIDPDRKPLRNNHFHIPEILTTVIRT